MTDVENVRYELGKEARAKGQPLHEGASEEWARGYQSTGGSLAFGSNVSPRKFGRGGQEQKPWECVCGHLNQPNRRVIRAGREHCWVCNIERQYSDIEILEVEDGQE